MCCTKNEVKREIRGGRGLDEDRSKVGIRNLRIPFGRSYWVRPGLLLAGCYPGDKDKNIAAQKLQALLACGIRHIINLMEPGETDKYGRPFVPYGKDFITLAKAKGIDALVSRMPIEDGSIPTAETMKVIPGEQARSVLWHLFFARAWIKLSSVWFKGGTLASDI